MDYGIGILEVGSIQFRTVL